MDVQGPKLAKLDEINSKRPEAMPILDSKRPEAMPNKSLPS